MRILRTAFLVFTGFTLLWGLQCRDRIVSALQHPPSSGYTTKAQSGVVHASTTREEGIFFSPSDDLEEIDVSLIQQASRSIKVAMYAFTDRRIAAALKRQAARGVQVSIYRDREQFEEERLRRSGVTEMLATQSNIHIRVKGTKELMHDKVMLIDDAILRDGSGNWSVSAARYQDNQVTISEDARQTAAFNRGFEAMWNRKDNRIVQ